jgi:hypothetical protein
MDDLLMDLAWSAIRAWRRRREVDPKTRRQWVRLYVGVIRRARRGGALKGSPLNCELPSNSLDPDQSVPSVPRTVADRLRYRFARSAVRVERIEDNARTEEAGTVAAQLQYRLIPCKS